MKTRLKCKVQSTKRKVQGSRFKVQVPNSRKYLFPFTLFLLLTAYCLLLTDVYAAEKWPGVDESVIEKVAQEHGREAKTPLINTDQGDLLLFLFLLAGAVGGFIGGYYWRLLTEEKTKSERGNQ
jgi:ABC-type cobalt transport system substrate-binding protein